MVIFDNSILSGLHRINKLDLLFCVFKNEELIVPEAVFQEFNRKHSPNSLQNLDRRNFTGSYPLVLANFDQLHKLGKGEKEELALAIQLDDIFVTDDGVVLKSKQKLGVKIVGTVAILLQAFDLNCFSSVQDYIDTIKEISKVLYLNQTLLEKLYSKIS